MEANIPKKDLIVMRAGVADDVAFIMSTWLNGTYYGSDWMKEIEKGIFMSHYHDLIERILSQRNTLVKVACLREEPSVILGYCAYQDNILHYVFVKPVWRKIGLARDMVPKGVIVTSHLTNVGRSIKPSSIAFNPFLILGASYE